MVVILLDSTAEFIEAYLAWRLVLAADGPAGCKSDDLIGAACLIVAALDEQKLLARSSVSCGPSSNSASRTCTLVY